MFMVSLLTQRVNTALTSRAHIPASTSTKSYQAMTSNKYYIEKNFITYYPTDGYGVAIYNIDSRDTTFFQGQNDNLKKLFELECFDLSIFQQLISCDLKKANKLIRVLLLKNIISEDKSLLYVN